MSELAWRDLEHLRRVEAAGGEQAMSYGETSSTLRLTEAGLLRWWQTSPFVARVALTDAGRALLAAPSTSTGRPDS